MVEALIEFMAKGQQCAICVTVAGSWLNIVPLLDLVIVGCSRVSGSQILDVRLKHNNIVINSWPKD